MPVTETLPQDRPEHLHDSVATTALLAQVAIAAAGEEDLGQILAGTLERLARFIPFTGGSIALVDGDELVVRAAIGPFADRALAQRLARGHGLSWRIVESGEPFISADLVAAGLHAAGEVGAPSLRSWLAVPLVRRGTGIGLLEVDSTATHAFDASDLELLRTVASVLSGPVELASRYEVEVRARTESEAAQRRLERLARALSDRERQQAAVASLGQAALEETPLATLFTQAAHLVAETLGHEFASVLIVEPDRSALRRVGGVGWSELGVTDRVPLDASTQVRFTFESAQPVIIDDLARETRFPPSSTMIAAGVHGSISVPIGRAPTAGVLTTHSRSKGAFRDEDVNFLTSIAHVLATAIERDRIREHEARTSALRDAFIGVISHELRTPITTIYGSTKVLTRADTALPTELQREILADIESEAERLRRLVEDLLVLSRAERGRVEIESDPVLISHVIARVVQSEQSRWPATSFVATVPPNLPAVTGEETYIEQILRNLISNAAKYGPAGGTVRVTAAQEAESVVVRVEDEGPGFAPDEADRLFELFYRSQATSGQASGAGIGLFVTRQLVEAMGGRTWALPRRGGGAEFGFLLPSFEAGDE